MTTKSYVDLSTILGRVIAGLRQDRGKSQAKLAAELGWDRSLLSRIESGRNTATIDNIYELEEVFLQDDLITDHGDLTELVAKVVGRARRRGLRLVYGQVARRNTDEPIAIATLDRIVLNVVDRWLNKLEEEAEDDDEQEEDEP